MGGISAPRFKGKLKRDIAIEAFKKLGKYADYEQVNAYFRKHYKIRCEPSMFARARAKSQGKPGPVKRRYRGTKRKDMVGIIARIRELAKDVESYPELAKIVRGVRRTANDTGGYDRLLEIIDALSEGT